MENDEPIGQRGEREAARRQDEDRKGDQDRRDLEEPRVAVLDADRRQPEQGQGQEEQDGRFPPTAGGRGPGA